MPDLIAEFSLPSNGKLYTEQVQWKNQIRAPRLRDRGFGDTTRKLKLQASILDKTIVQPLGMSAYDLHTADFVYLNWMSRKLSKGGAPYKISIICKNCGVQHDIDIPMSDIEVQPLTESLDLTYTTLEEHVLELNYITPRMLDTCVDRANEFKQEYKETDLSFDALKTQELLRMVIRTVDGSVMTPPRMTDFISNLYDGDIEGIFDTVNNFDFGVQTNRSYICTNCGKKIRYVLPLG